MKNKTLVQIVNLKREEKALKESRLNIRLEMNKARRKVYSKYTTKLISIDRRLNVIDDSILELCDLIK